MKIKNDETLQQFQVKIINLCNIITSKLDNELTNPDKENEQHENQIPLWKKDDTAIDILNKLANISSKIQPNPNTKQNEFDQELTQTDINIIMDFCQQYDNKSKPKNNKKNRK